MSDNKNIKPVAVVLRGQKRIVLPTIFIKDLEVEDGDTFVFRKEGDNDWRISKLDLQSLNN